MFRLMKFSAFVSVLMCAVFGVSAFADAPGQGELVSTDSDSLLAIEGSIQPQDVNYLEVKEFLSCFVENMDLPTQVYVDCGVALVQSAMNCRAGVLNYRCISSAVRVATTCSLPVSRAVEGAQTCWSKLNPGIVEESFSEVSEK